jgi:hypothetical protein
MGTEISNDSWEAVGGDVRHVTYKMWGCVNEYSPPLSQVNAWTRVVLCNSGQVAYGRTHRIVAYVTRLAQSALIYTHWVPPH